MSARVETINGAKKARKSLRQTEEPKQKDSPGGQPRLKGEKKKRVRGPRVEVRRLLKNRRR